MYNKSCIFTLNNGTINCTLLKLSKILTLVKNFLVFGGNYTIQLYDDYFFGSTRILLNLANTRIFKINYIKMNTFGHVFYENYEL